MLGTGGNSASFNTGGSVLVASGNTSASTNITNAGSSNVDLMGGAGCNGGSTTAVLGGNGAFSTNSVNVQNSNSNSVKQTAENDFLNNVTEQLSTGHNSANFNTGTNVELLPGSAAVQTSVWNQAGSNSLL
jgi:hypothetical protein